MTWATNETSRFTDSDGGDHEYQSTATYRIADAPQDVLDRYGFPTSSVVISSHSLVTSPEDGPRERNETQAIEIGGGNWLVMGWFSGTLTSSCGGSSPFGSFSLSHASRGGTPIHTDTMEHFENGTLLGHTLRVGDTVEHRQARETDLGRFETTVVFRAVARTSIDSPLLPGTDQTDAMVVESIGESRIVFNGPSGEAWTFTSRERLHFIDGVALPIRKEGNLTGPEGPPSTYREELLSYGSASAPIPWGNGPQTTQFDPLHPDATLAPLGLAPNTEGLSLEYEFEEALAWLRTDPRAENARVWLETHPDAYAFRAAYDRDVRNRTYEWEFRFVDGESFLWAGATRSVTAVGVALDEAWTKGSGSIRGAPSSAEAHALQLVPLSLAYDVARKFLAAPDDWVELSWRVFGGPFSNVDGTLPTQLRFSLGQAGREASYIAPGLSVGSMEWSSHFGSIDGSNGGAAASLGGGGSCSTGLGVEPPLASFTVHPTRWR